jgi:hypothetical protein
MMIHTRNQTLGLLVFRKVFCDFFDPRVYLKYICRGRLLIDRYNIFQFLGLVLSEKKILESFSIYFYVETFDS